MFTVSWPHYQTEIQSTKEKHLPVTMWSKQQGGLNFGCSLREVLLLT